jgi:electron transfer flavoprotein alpha subunit
MSRLRIERRRLPAPGPKGRLRRDPRAERLGISMTQASPPQELSAETVGPSGRIRRDPRATRRSGRTAPATAPAAVPALPRRAVLENPACLILAVPDLEDGRLDSHDRDLLGAARLLADAGSGNVVALVPEGAAADFAAAGADCLLPMRLPPGYAPEARTGAVLQAVESLAPRHVLFADRPTSGGDIGRRIAAALGEMPAARVLRLSPAEAASRGNGGASDFLRRPPRIILLAPEAADPASGAVWEARPLPAIDRHAARGRLTDNGLVAADPNAVPLTEADFIVSAGNGVSDWQAFHEVAAALGAVEGGSRVVCDAGLLPRGRQVGASGSLVEPRCYLAFGIAGATQHLQGITRCERVVAVNTDLHADMVKRADLAIIADAQLVMPALAKLARDRLKGGRDAS